MTEKKKYTYDYPRPAVTVDVAVFARKGAELSVLLIQRKHDPFKGAWALPGGFVDENEALEHAAHRELEEETSVSGLTLTQVAAFGDPGRDPRGHTVSVAFVTETDGETAPVKAADDAADARFHPWSSLALPGASRATPPLVTLAFDHAKVLVAARAKLEGRG